MPHHRISVAAEVLGVSDDTVRRMIEAGTLAARTDGSGRMTVDGAALAQEARRRAAGASGGSRESSARNRFSGLVTGIGGDGVMSQVELQCGPFRVVSLMSTEAVRELGLEPGSLATAVIKATNVIVEAPRT